MEKKSFGFTVRVMQTTSPFKKMHTSLLQLSPKLDDEPPPTIPPQYHTLDA